MTRPIINITLPDWCDTFLSQDLSNDFTQEQQTFLTLESRMHFVLNVANENIKHGGGPFGAAVFDQNGKALSIGMNLVTLTNCSLAHAEVVALVMAEKIINSYDLSKNGEQHLQLVTTCEPCTMCLGALIWSGVDSLVCGARDEDARAIGFDEGPKPSDVSMELAKRGIKLTRDVLREEAIELLQHYRSSGQPIYNAGKERMR